MAIAPTAAELAAQAQNAMRATGQAFRVSLRADVFALRHEAGLHKMLDLAREMRAKALHDLSSGTKEKFEGNQATYRAWDDICVLIEFGPPVAPAVPGQSGP